MAKDFGLIESDYAFFMTHATEAEADAACYSKALKFFADERSQIRLLDFGCGTGEFSERLLTRLNWSAERLSLALVEPVPGQVETAAGRLTRFTTRPIATGSGLTQLPVDGAAMDLVLSNHVLYYVENLDETLGELIAVLAPGGKLLTAIAPWSNMLLQLWQQGFALLGRPVPYHAAEDVAECLVRRRAAFQMTSAPYELRFADSVENRKRILRFLFAENLPQLPLEAMLASFEPYVRGKEVVVETSSDHFEVSG